MKKLFLLALALAVVLTAADAAYTGPKIRPDEINTSQPFPSILMDEDANITLDGGFIFNTPLDSGWVSIGDGAEFDIDIGDYSDGMQGEAINDAIDLSMSRSGNRAVAISIGPCDIDDSDNPNPIYLNHSSATGASFVMQGVGIGWFGGTTIVAPHGIVLGEFGSYTDAPIIRELMIIGNQTAPSGVGFSCNRSGTRVTLRDIRVGYYDYGINLTSMYSGTIDTVYIGDCDIISLYLSGNNNNLRDILCGQTKVPSAYGVLISGNYNEFSGDIGYAGSYTGSTGLAIYGNGNKVPRCWLEPSANETCRALIVGRSNDIHMTGADNEAPYGYIELSSGGGNYIDPGYVPAYSTDGLMLNITFTNSYFNTIKMDPNTQSASAGVLSRTNTEFLEYGHLLYTSAPPWGYWYTGAVVYNSAPAVGQPIGWMCNSTGSPGVWVSMGNAA